MKTAVAFIVFNRPAVTRRVFAAIRQARPLKLFVIADGPRADKLGERGKCAQVQSIIEAGVDWPCEVIKIYSVINLGCALRVSSGLTEVFKTAEEAIILEDDCLPDQSFFPFCEELLERYRNDARVAQIAGCSFVEDYHKDTGNSYFFSRYPHCWGWATWRRSWETYDHSMSAWRSCKTKVSWPLKLTHQRERKHWKNEFDAVARGKLDSWAYRWTLAMWQRQGLSANTCINLISNLGFGSDATHTKEGKWGGMPLGVAEFPLIHPKQILANNELDKVVSKRVYLPPTLTVRIFSKIKRIMIKTASFLIH
jgi:hypothetical protein